MCKALTPPPLTNRHKRLKTTPNFPSTNLFTNPKAISDRGIMNAKGTMAALNLSSGYHTPLRFLRHLITIWSETRPTMVTPTVMIDRRLCMDPFKKERDLKRTHASDTCR